jgi:mercuric ion binding protein
MKTIKLLLIAVCTTFSISVIGQDKTESFKVYGNCGMCKKRVETAAKLDGVSSAVWDVDTKMMTVTYKESTTNKEAIQKKIASVGHDTELFSADDKVYKKLPGCCLYERKPSAPIN